MQRFSLVVCLTVLAGLTGVRAGLASPALDRPVVLTVRVSVDAIGVGFPCQGCNGTLDSGDANRPPLPPMEIVVRDSATGGEIAHQPTRHLPGTGASYAWFLLQPQDGLTVELSGIPAEFQLCPNSPQVRRLEAADLSRGHAFVSYALWRGCPLMASPTPTPTSSLTVTSTPTATLTPTPSSTPSSTSTSTATPSATPTATATASPTATATATPTPSPTFTPCPASIAGLVWEDGNENGVRDVGEPALAHAIVTLWEVDVALQSLATGADGRYNFPGLVPGRYRVVETDPPGYRSTTAALVTIDAGCGLTTQDFGDHLPANVCPRGVNGVVWHDVDGDGVLGLGERPLSGATLTLRDSAGAVVGAPQVTGVDGIYVFGVLAEDVYTLFEDNPPGFPISTTLDNWAIDLIGCRNVPVTINFGDRAAPAR
ncbi:MAG: collagen binding domain-containing protein [Anaerolineae bacterium]